MTWSSEVLACSATLCSLLDREKRVSSMCFTHHLWLGSPLVLCRLSTIDSVKELAERCTDSVGFEQETVVAVRAIDDLVLGLDTSAAGQVR